MRFEKYESYKDSGLEWLGDIPSEWEVKRVKDTFRYFGSGSTPLTTNMKYYDDSTIPWLNTTDIKNNIVNNTKYKVTELAKNDYSLKIYPVNSLAIGMYGQGETRGNVALLNIKVATNQNAGIMYKFSKSSCKFIFWWFIGRKTHIRQIGNVAIIPNLNKDIVRNLFISLPPLKTQTKIALYLDTQTQKIDKEIKLLEEKSLKYKELKQTLINETVLRGLDKSVKFETKRLKDILYLSSGEMKSKKEDGLFNLFGANGIIGKTDNFNINKKHIIIGRVGSSGTINEADAKSWISDNALIVHIKKSLSFYKFIYYILISLNLIKFSTSNAQPLITATTIKNIKISLPPLKEQKEIANFLDEKTQKIDAITKTITTKITFLKEFRKTLINDTVTGKIKVK